MIPRMTTPTTETAEIETMAACPQCGKPGRLEGSADQETRWYVCLDGHRFHVEAHGE